MLEIYKKIDLERKLDFLIKSGKTREEAVTILMNEEKEIDANYIIEAYIMPIDEITKDIEKYDSSKPKFNDATFISELCEKYCVDRKAIIERIRNVRKINKYKKIDNKERLDKLKRKRDYIQKEKDKLSDKTMNFEEKTMYYFGFTVTAIVASLLFYSTSPLSVGFILIMYLGGIPLLRLNAINKAEIRYTRELLEVGNEIEFIEERLNIEKDYVLDNSSKELNVYDMPKNISKDKILVKKLHKKQ